MASLHQGTMRKLVVCLQARVWRSLQDKLGNIDSCSSLDEDRVILVGVLLSPKARSKGAAAKLRKLTMEATNIKAMRGTSNYLTRRGFDILEEGSAHGKDHIVIIDCDEGDAAEARVLLGLPGAGL